MAKPIAAAALIAAVVVGVGMTAPAFAERGGHGGGAWSSSSNPPGWSHGNKTGWGGRSMPPGLYKKYYSNSSRTRSSGYSSRYSGSSSYYRNYPSYYGY